MSDKKIQLEHLSNGIVCEIYTKTSAKTLTHETVRTAVPCSRMLIKKGKRH
jgi:hypothetical protein